MTPGLFIGQRLPQQGGCFVWGEKSSALGWWWTPTPETASLPIPPTPPAPKPTPPPKPRVPPPFHPSARTILLTPNGEAAKIADFLNNPTLLPKNPPGRPKLS